MPSKRICSFALVLALCLVAPLAAPALFYVDQFVPSSGDGTSWATAFKTIQEGINVAEDGDEVIVAVGTYTESVDFKGLAIAVRSTDPSSPGVVSSTVIEFGRPSGVILFRSGETRNAVLSGFTIASGQVGISCVWSSPTIRNNTIVANTAPFDEGGGISCYYSSPLIENNIIASNIASGGGAGIACEGAKPVIVGNLILGNVTDAEGGGILCINCWPTIARNRIIANSAQGNGGGISCWSSHAEISNNLVIRNVANSLGGGIACHLSASNIVGNTIADNVSQGGGAGGIHFMDSSGTILNCIVWGNGDDLSGAGAAFSCVEDNDPEDQGPGNLHDYPAFEDPDGADNVPGTQDDDYRLSESSPCLDKGLFSGVVRLSIQKDGSTFSLSWNPGTDLSGQSRLLGTAPDIGCHERPGTPPLYVLESSLDLQQWSPLHEGAQTTYSLPPLPPEQRQFFRVSLGQP